MAAHLANLSVLVADRREKAERVSVFLYGKQREILAYEQMVMLSVQQIIEYYSARWKIESGFKKIKQ